MKLRLIGISLILALTLGLMPSGAIAQRRQRRDRDRMGSAQNVYCESGDMRRHWCSEGMNASVRLVRQRSDARCVQGRTWGVDRSGIWVDRGCRAVFEVRR